MRINETLGRLVTACGVALGLIAPSSGAHAAGFQVVYSFVRPQGEFPEARLIEDSAGNLYGTTVQGGGPGKQGTVFRLAPDGSETVVHAFSSGSDGANPEAALLMGNNGILYGTTSLGGGMGSCGERHTRGCGTIFAVGLDGGEIVFHAFTGGSDGAFPKSQLIVDARNNLYGTTVLGGGSDYGTVFELTHDRKFKVLHTFSGYPDDGASPLDGLVLDGENNLYGTTANGGGGTCNCGAVFKVSPDGTETILHAFTRGSDGAAPYDALIEDAAGDFYGTTESGGGKGCGGGGCGTVFKITPAGNETVLYRFAGGADAANPEAGVVLDASGNLYGTTPAGGQYGYGTVYELAMDGTDTVLYSFDGYSPSAGLLKSARGELCGVSAYERNGYGEIWKLSK